MTHLYTTLGPYRADQLGLILPHEHVFVDLRTPDQPGYAQADLGDVIRLMVPELECARSAGVTALVECSPVGVGRRIDILKAVSQAANFPLVVPTGVYRQPWVPDWVQSASEEDLTAWMSGELTGQVEDTGVPAGFVKLSAGDDGLTAVETKILRAAARAAAPLGAAIGSHTIRGRVVRDQLDIAESCSFTPQRFIWIHANVEPDFSLNIELARRGAWVEYDAIGSNQAADDLIFERIQWMLDAGLGDHILLSMDRGWYDPAQPGGGFPRSFAYFTEVFVPRMNAAGIDESTCHLLTRTNPFKAFAR